MKSFQAYRIGIGIHRVAPLNFKPFKSNLLQNFTKHRFPLPEHARIHLPLLLLSSFFFPPPLLRIVPQHEGKRRADERTEGKVECSVVELA